MSECDILKAERRKRKNEKWKSTGRKSEASLWILEINTLGQHLEQSISFIGENAKVA